MSKIVYADDREYATIPSDWFKRGYWNINDKKKDWDLKSHWKDGRIIRSDNLLEGL